MARGVVCAELTIKVHAVRRKLVEPRNHALNKGAAGGAGGRHRAKVRGRKVPSAHAEVKPVWLGFRGVRFGFVSLGAWVWGGGGWRNSLQIGVGRLVPVDRLQEARVVGLHGHELKGGGVRAGSVGRKRPVGHGASTRRRAKV